MYKHNKEIICEYVDLPTGEVSHQAIMQNIHILQLTVQVFFFFLFKIIFPFLFCLN